VDSREAAEQLRHSHLEVMRRLEQIVDHQMAVSCGQIDPL
jgi:hypothetical protein